MPSTWTTRLACAASSCWAWTAGPTTPPPRPRRGQRRGAGADGGVETPRPWSRPSSRCRPAGWRRSRTRRCSRWRTPPRCRSRSALALAALPRVARTGTHLFQFATYVEQFRGWGRGLRRAVAGWYTEKEAGALAYQAVKYRQRDGWTHRDLLRLAHPVGADAGSARHVRVDRQRLGRRRAPDPGRGLRPGPGSHAGGGLGPAGPASTGCRGRCCPTPRSASRRCGTRCSTWACPRRR